MNFDPAAAYTRCVGRLGYRTVLPVLQLLLFTSLTWFACPYRTTWECWRHPENTAGWCAEFIYETPPFLEQLAEGLYYPATLPGELLIPFNKTLRSGAAQELAQHLATAVFIPIVWFLIGRAIDRRRVRQSNILLPSMFQKMLTTLTIVILGILSGVITVAIVRLGVLEFSILRVLVLAWLATGITVFSRRVRNWRRSAPAA